MPIWMWLAASGALLVIEILTVDLLFASLAFSALLAAGANALGFSVVVQGVVFGVGAIGSLMFLRPIALRHLKKKPADHATNIEALIGAPAMTLSAITEHDGLVKLSGETWSARSNTGEIEVGSQVEVVAIEGATAVVKRKG
ncbi:MAG: NfeD family protein [Candidatus Planktophila sp.]|nr:NfeD family protein [Candidatus Planktophila sp.]